ncbi:serine protease [Magnetovibrio sp. PR-2]|uniref:trypsin-like serine peptidase n=1 Tax=Magnetovibrio sp. PR-2 TaxID=3120356 RepID=UPI002FCE3149
MHWGSGFSALFLMAIAWSFSPVSDAHATDLNDVLREDAPGIGGSQASVSTQNPDAALAVVAQKYQGAVGLVTGIGAKGKRIPIGTAWAVGPSRFVTNAHVTESVKKILEAGIDVYVLLNRSRTAKLKVISFSQHPKYDEIRVKKTGAKAFGNTYDVAFIEVAGKTDTYFPVAHEKELRSITPGYRVAYLGFPMEGLANGNVDVSNPLATMQSGIVSSMSDYYFGDSGFKNNVIIRHNLPLSGGASGSPLFNVRGEVIGVISAGNMSRSIEIDAKTKDVRLGRTPSAAMVNFAQRIDLVHEIPGFRAPQSRPATSKGAGDKGFKW